MSTEIATEIVDVSDLEAGGLRALELHGRKLLLCRVADEIYAGVPAEERGEMDNVTPLRAQKA